MENRFATENLIKSLSNYPVAKGDVPGHEFHGNQYASAAEHALSLKHRAMNNTTTAKFTSPEPPSASEARSIAEGHRTIASQLSGTAKSAHTRAANLHEGFATLLESGVNPRGATATSASERASGASQKAYYATPGAKPRAMGNSSAGESDSVYYQGRVPEGRG